MKKLTLLFAALVLSFTAQAKVINAVPEGDIAYYLSIAESGDIIELADGVYDEEAILTFSVNGLVVKAAEGANPVIQTVGKWMAMNVEAATTFEGIVFDAEAGTDGDNQYGFNISANTTFNNCKFQDYTKYAVTLLAGTTTFDNCVFDGAGVTPSAIVIDGTIAECSIENSEFKNYKDYSISVEDNTTIATLTIDQCVFDGANTTPVAIYARGIIEDCTIEGTEFKNYTEYCIYANDYYGARYDNLIINNCLFHDCTYSAVYLAEAKDGLEKQSCSDFTLTNSTIYNVGNNPEGDNVPKRAVVEIRKKSSVASEQKVLIDHITIYNFPAPDYCGAFKVDQTNNTTISNCIAMNPDNIYKTWINPFVISTGATISNSVYFNCGYIDNGATQSNLVKADPMFVDAANADFMLYAESPAIGMGDPRWGVKAGLKPGAEVLKKAVAAAAPGATITLGDGIYEEPYSFDFDEEGLTIVAAEGTNPVIKTTGEWTSLGIVASTTFDGITFDGGNLTKTSLDTKGTAAQTLTLRNCEFKNYTDYNINVAENTTINTITIDNCVFDGVKATKAAILARGIVTTCTIEDSEFKNYAEYCIAANDSYRGRIDNLSINNCLLHDGVVAVYMPKYADEGTTQTCANFTLTNSTIYNMVGTKWEAVIDIRSNPEAEEALNKVVIDHITLYNFTTTELGGITSRKSTDVLITNSIIANPADKANQYAYHLYGAAAINNTLTFNTKTSGGTPTNPINADPLFVNAAENNFDLYANSPAVGAGTDGSNLGDPRWGVSAKVLGKRINVTPDQASSLPWMIQSDESNVKAGDTIVLAAGTYELSSFELRKEGLVIMAAENAEVKIATKEGEYLKLVATTTFEGITFDGSNVANYAIRSIGTSAKNLIVRNCEFTQYARYNIYGANDTHMDSLVVDNCIFSNSGAAIYFPASALADNVPGCSYAKVTNSTLYNIILNDYVAAIDIQENNDAIQTGNTEVVIDHVTIYNFSSTAKSAIKVYKSGKTNITNSIVANPAESDHYSFMIYEGAKVQNCLEFNAVGHWASNAYTDTICADPLFVDAANNDFMLQANSPAIGKATDGSNLGDPRWGVAEPELITLTTGDNDAVIEANIGKTVNVKIERSFTANDGYYTLCVPFKMPASVIGKAYSLGTITEHVSGQGININLEEESELLAGVPYLVLPKANMSELVVENVTILSDIASGQNVYSKELNVNIFFEGFYSAPGRTTNGTTEYYVGNNGYLYKGEVEIRGLCGLFTITDENGAPLNVRARVVTREEVETDLDNNQLPNTNIQKVLENGQLIIIRDGVKYNVQGQVIK